MKPVQICFSLLLSTSLAGLLLSPSACALETSPAMTLGSQDFTLETDDKEHEKERKEIENTLANVETLWNAHNLDGVMSNYADDYVNNDGLDKKSVTNLTQEFWKTYPDAKSASKTKQIRIEGNYATIESRDMAVGTTSKDMPGMSSKGELQSLSEGQLYLKRVANVWKIIGDRIDYEKVKVAFGLAKQLNATFTAPEQIKSGKQYSAKLEVSLPPGLFAVGSITSQPLRFPQPAPSDSPRPLEAPALERVMSANNENRNELLTATVILTNPMRTSVMGVSFLTRRLNVIPEAVQNKDEIQVANKTPDKVELETKIESKSESKSESKIESKSESKTESKPESKLENKTENKPEVKPDSSSPANESR